MNLDLLSVVIISIAVIIVGFCLGVLYRKMSAEKSIKSAEKEAEKASFPEPEPSREEQLEAQVAALQSQVDALLGVSE